MKVSIGKAAEVLGVTRQTLRRWEAVGKLSCDRTVTNQRRYDISMLMNQRRP